MRPTAKLAERYLTVVGFLALLLAPGGGTACAPRISRAIRAGEALATVAQGYTTSVEEIG